MESQTPPSPPSRPSLKEALGLSRRVPTGAGAGGAAGAGSESTGSSGAGTSGTPGGEDAAAGLGVDEFVDPLAGEGRDGSGHADMKHLPGNALNMVEMYQLRERAHVMAQESARRSGDRRSVRLDSVGLELLQQMQRDIERAHFSQAAMSTRGKPKDVAEESFAGGRPEGIQPRRDEPPVDVWRADAPAADEEDAPLRGDPDRSMTSVARDRAARQRETLLDLCADAHAQAASDLAVLNQAEGRTNDIRAHQAKHLVEPMPQEDSADELKADNAEQFEAAARQHFAASHARAVQLAGAVQRRRIGLNGMLRDKAPRAPR